MKLPLLFLFFLILFSDIVFSQKAVSRKSNYSIISAYKQYDPKSSTADSTSSTLKDFHRWNLTKWEISDILKSSKPISGTEWDLSYLVLPFWYKGEFLINGKKGKYEINAASFAILQINDTTIYLGCTLKSKYKYFLEHPDTN